MEGLVTKMSFKPPVRMTVRIQRVGLNLKRGIKGKGRPRAHTAEILQLQREEAVEVKNR